MTPTEAIFSILDTIREYSKSVYLWACTQERVGEWLEKESALDYPELVLFASMA